VNEQHLKEQGITIESFVHHNGSPYGQYWGYFVAQQNGGGKPILHGKRTSSKQQRPIDPFSRRRKAYEFALSLTDQEPEGDYWGFDIHEDPWFDIGGES